MLGLLLIIRSDTHWRRKKEEIILSDKKQVSDRTGQSLVCNKWLLSLSSAVFFTSLIRSTLWTWASVRWKIRSLLSHTGCVFNRVSSVSTMHISLTWRVCCTWIYVCVCGVKGEREGKKIALRTMDPKERNATIHSSDQTIRRPIVSLSLSSPLNTQAMKRRGGWEKESNCELLCFYYSQVRLFFIQLLICESTYDFFLLLCFVHLLRTGMRSEQTRKRTIRHLFYPSCAQGSWTTTATAMQSSFVAPVQ